jgi:hypothetical protein
MDEIDDIVIDKSELVMDGVREYCEEYEVALYINPIKQLKTRRFSKIL